MLLRLFPWVDRGEDAWRSLLWANERIVLDGKNRLTEEDWAWHCASLDEWTGAIPTWSGLRVTPDSNPRQS